MRIFNHLDFLQFYLFFSQTAEAWWCTFSSPTKLASTIASFWCYICTSTTKRFKLFWTHSCFWGVTTSLRSISSEFWPLSWSLTTVRLAYSTDCLVPLWFVDGAWFQSAGSCMALITQMPLLLSQPQVWSCTMIFDWDSFSFSLGCMEVLDFWSHFLKN